MNIKVANNINNKYVKLKLKINLVGKYTAKPTGIIVNNIILIALLKIVSGYVEKLINIWIILSDK